MQNVFLHVHLSDIITLYVLSFKIDLLQDNDTYILLWNGEVKVEREVSCGLYESSKLFTELLSCDSEQPMWCGANFQKKKKCGRGPVMID